MKTLAIVFGATALFGVTFAAAAQAPAHRPVQMAQASTGTSDSPATTGSAAQPSEQPGQFQNSSPGVGMSPEQSGAAAANSSTEQQRGPAMTGIANPSGASRVNSGGGSLEGR